MFTFTGYRKNLLYLLKCMILFSDFLSSTSILNKKQMCFLLIRTKLPQVQLMVWEALVVIEYLFSDKVKLLKYSSCFFI